MLHANEAKHIADSVNSSELDDLLEEVELLIKKQANKGKKNAELTIGMVIGSDCALPSVSRVIRCVVDVLNNSGYEVEYKIFGLSSSSIDYDNPYIKFSIVKYGLEISWD